MTRSPTPAKQTSADEAAQSRRESLSAPGAFAASIMHEINNPLEAISNLAYLVREEADDPQKVRDYIKLLEEQLATVIHIANQTLSYYRPAHLRQEVRVAALAEAALRVHQQKIDAKQIHLLKGLPDDATVVVHPGEMLQVISNLVANAVDALPVKGTLCLRVKKLANEVQVTVADDGHGIPPAILDDIFNPFFTTKNEHGTGLGLAISKDIVERHNGRIKTRSSVRTGHCGTAFRISLPLPQKNNDAN